jgi:exoribonuclease-2
VEEAEAQAAGGLPNIVLQLLFKPDKNGIEYKALDAAAKELHTTPQRLMLAAGGVASPKDLHYGAFLRELPARHGLPGHRHPRAATDLPVADVQAFSIDDVTTTEIDDACRSPSWPTASCAWASTSPRRAWPSSAATRSTSWRARACPPSTCRAIRSPCCPTIWWLPSRWAGAARPALSLYATLDPASWSVLSTETRAELVPIAANLRHNDLDDLVNEEALASGAATIRTRTTALIWQWAQVLEAAAWSSARLRPASRNRTTASTSTSTSRRRGQHRPPPRGAPLDKIVAELMIFANSTWGKLMHDHGVPGIYRARAAVPAAGPPRCRCAC